MKNLNQKILSKKAILWDFDGCLCDSERVHFLAYQKAFQQFNHTINESEYFVTFTHTGGGANAEIKKYNLNCDTDVIRESKSKYYWEMIENGAAKLYQEIPELLKIFKKNKLINAIASNSPAKEINLILSKYEKTEVEIDHIVGLLPGMKKKPEPDLYLKALSDLQLKPEEVIVLEDSERGLEAANRAKCEAIWIENNENSLLNTNVPYLEKLSHKKLLELVKN